jgi:hypothetical protein
MLVTAVGLIRGGPYGWHASVETAFAAPPAVRGALRWLPIGTSEPIEV